MTICKKTIAMQTVASFSKQTSYLDSNKHHDVFQIRRTCCGGVIQLNLFKILVLFGLLIHCVAFLLIFADSVHSCFINSYPMLEIAKAYGEATFRYNALSRFVLLILFTKRA